MITSRRFYFFLIFFPILAASEFKTSQKEALEQTTGTTRVVHATAVPNPFSCPWKEIIPPVANTMEDVLYCLDRIRNIFLLLPIISV